MGDQLPEREEDVPVRADRLKKKRRDKEKPLEAGLDLSVKFPMGVC